MKKLPSSRPGDIDSKLKEKLSAIEALIAAITAEAPDCDLKLAAILEGEPEAVRRAIIDKLREMLKARDAEKEKELEKFLEKERRAQIERQRAVFKQWLQWMMSEETIRKMREAFLASPILERLVRGIGHQMAGKGMRDIHMGDKRDLGGISHNAPMAKGREKDRGEDKGRG